MRPKSTQQRLVVLRSRDARALSLAFGVVGGIIIGNLVVGWLFYWRSGKDLRLEANQLREESARARDLVNLLAHGLEASGYLKDVVWDEHGVLKSYIVSGTANIVLPRPIGGLPSESEETAG